MAAQRIQVRPAAHSGILGVGAYRPRRVVSNDEVCRRLDSTPEWIESRSGIVSRRFAGPEETLCAMAVAAAGAALQHAGVTPDAVGCVIVASMSNLVQTPPLAVLVADEIGAGRAAAFDLSGACAGFCHALAVAGDTVRAGEVRYVLVIGVERMTDIIDPADRGVAFMFADGAGAVLVGPTSAPAIGPVVRGANGAFREALRMSASWAEFGADPQRERPVMRMDGRRVFRWAVEEVVTAGRQALRDAGLGVSDLAAFVPHQANLRMIDVLADRLELPAHVVVARDVVTAGNTSAASIPMALRRLLDNSAAAPGGPALLFGFGAGLNYAGQVVLLPAGGARR
ncbi:beta-ketoacyl-ACP synthase 3 [Dactylosporangium vinaceum]|uniref:Beta-ketoacyl-ACP synthase 3 n=1 Tax=Dactylosporangium vinaceum TaxID=53362 RepID=A0ABV5M393_9ACTN|nr:beta-ketoacyl-ACP synthase 3 [Dactylosporangium vinaceum]UAB99752.1 beta-ketoacyl-ACP synthase 3 [Dactylosporangium vinaceum]